MAAEFLGMGRLCAKNISTLIILGCMLLIGLWGHHTKWSLMPAAKAQPVVGIESAQSQSDVAARPASDVKEKDIKTEAAESVDSPPPQQELSLTHIEFRSPDAVAKSGIETVAASELAMELEVVGHGVIVYDQTLLAQLSPRVAGTVWRVEKQVGQQIKKGDVLAIVEAVGVGEAKAGFLHALVQQDLKEKTFARLEKLEVIPERQRTEASAALREARIALHNAHQTLVNLGLPIDLKAVEGLSEQDLARRVQFLGLPEAIASELDPATTTANLLPLVAPFDGVVIGHDATIGEMVTPQSSSFIVADNSRMWLLLDISKEDSPRLQVGQEVTFKCDDGHEELHSKLNWISTEVDFKTRTVRARAEVENPFAEGTTQRRLRAQMFGTGLIRIRENPQVVVVPSDAVQWDGKKFVVFVQQDPTSFEARTVRIGIVRDGMTEVLDGLKLGETVVHEGSHMLKAELLRRRMMAQNPAHPNVATRLSSFLVEYSSLLAQHR